MARADGPDRTERSSEQPAAEPSAQLLLNELLACTLLAQPTLAPLAAADEGHVNGRWALATEVAQASVLVVLINFHCLSLSDLLQDLSRYD
jgi:hypothetical protein